MTRATRLAERGAIKFKANCAEWHAPLERTDLTSQINADMRPLTLIGTDLALACNTFAHMKTGETEERKVLIVLGERLKATEPTLSRLENAPRLRDVIRLTYTLVDAWMDS